MEEARAEAWQEAYSRGFDDGRKAERDRLAVTIDWSPVQDLMNRIYTDGVQKTQYVENREEAILTEDASWEQFSTSHAWLSVVRNCDAEANRRNADLIAGRGPAEAHRAVIQLCKGLTAVPDRIRSIADQVRAAQASEGRNQ